jgi:hypothetical protein
VYITPNNEIYILKNWGEYNGVYSLSR